MSEEELIDVIDENNQVIGTVIRKEMRTKNLLHRGVIIFVLNSEGKIFVHKRTATKDIHPSKYDMTCGGGVIAGENYETAAKRETQEEVGITNTNLKYLFDFRYKSHDDNYIAKVYSCVYDGELTIDNTEIEKGSFMTIEELKNLIKREDFCPDAIEIFKKYEEIQK